MPGKFLCDANQNNVTVQKFNYSYTLYNKHIYNLSLFVQHFVVTQLQTEVFISAMKFVSLLCIV